jgi:hypothetical protein
MSQPEERAMSRSVRVAFGTVLGLLFGVCMVILFSRSELFPGDRMAAQWLAPTGRIFVLISYGILGFTISISGLQMPWPIHGAVLGLVMSLPGSVWLMRVYSMFNPGAGAAQRLFFLLLVLGVLFGLFIELVLSGVLRMHSFSGTIQSDAPTVGLEEKKN